MVRLLYGSGLRLMACWRWRVKRLDFAAQHLTVRNGKDTQDRVTMLPKSLVEPDNATLPRDNACTPRIAEGCGEVYWPYALERMYPNAGKSWAWQ